VHAGDLVIDIGTPEDGRLPIALAGDLDMPATFRLEPELERHIGAEDVSSVVLDCSGVAFLDSAGLGTLLATRERAEDLGVRLTVANPSPVVRRVLELTGTTQLLDT
jgi:stage II sporulation protein AA (anti-sigma F factor antagonist)